jgi:hypothetical protein
MNAPAREIFLMIFKYVKEAAGAAPAVRMR